MKNIIFFVVQFSTEEANVLDKCALLACVAILVGQLRYNWLWPEQMASKDLHVVK